MEIGTKTTGERSKYYAVHDRTVCTGHILRLRNVKILTLISLPIFSRNLQIFSKPPYVTEFFQQKLSLQQVIWNNVPQAAANFIFRLELVDHMKTKLN